VDIVSPATAFDARTSKAGTRASEIYSLVRSDIIAARLPPGSKLKIAELASKYDVGIAPVREALNRLSAESLVVQTDQRGFSVAAISPDDLDDLLRARRWLNEVALRESIAHGGQDWEEGVLVACHRLLKISRRTELDDGASSSNPQWEEAHRAFHKSLLAACGSSWVLSFCDQLFLKSERYRHIARSASAARSATAAKEHRAIMEVALARRTEDAIRLLNAHFTQTALMVRKSLYPHPAQTKKSDS
jgi:GntR family transcriptional regulator, carbon starvation induced regulator